MQGSGAIVCLHYSQVIRQFGKALHGQFAYASPVLLQFVRLLGPQVVQAGAGMGVDIIKGRAFLHQVLKDFNDHHVLDNVGEPSGVKRVAITQQGYGFLTVTGMPLTPA